MVSSARIAQERTSPYTRAIAAIDEARKRVSDVVDVTDAPGPIASKVDSAFIALAEVVEDATARNVAASKEPGEVIYPIASRDPRHWPTSAGRIASEVITKGRTASMLRSATRIRVADRVMKRRAITASQFAEAIEGVERTPAPTPRTSSVIASDDRSFCTVVLH
jgi:hypothetical protein